MKMIYNIPEPELSPDFTIKDIHKIREWHYEILKDATIKERKEFYSRGAAEVEAQIEVIRAGRKVRAM
jgi:hypothetical protein